MFMLEVKVSAKHTQENRSIPLEVNSSGFDEPNLFIKPSVSIRKRLTLAPSSGVFKMNTKPPHINSEEAQAVNSTSTVFLKNKTCFINILKKKFT